MAEPEWQGVLGPTLHATVGDTINVFARNALDVDVSWHPHGVQYQKGGEGAPYADGSSAADKLDDAVPPGGTHTYVWCVPASAGPAAKDGSSIAWLYHDHVSEINGTNGGLVGAIVVQGRASERPGDGGLGVPARAADVDHEFVLLFAAMNENSALHAERNVEERLPLFRPAARPDPAPRPPPLDPPQSPHPPIPTPTHTHTAPASWRSSLPPLVRQAGTTRR